MKKQIQKKQTVNSVMKQNKLIPDVLKELYDTAPPFVKRYMMREIKKHNKTVK